MDTKLIVSASPHLRSEETTTGLMANVIVALTPCVVASAIIFGLRALLVTAVSVVACVAFEWLYCKLMKKANPISDLSAVVTGIILAMNVPVGMPIGELLIGDFVAIIVVKQLFGGIGMNFANPALAHNYTYTRSDLCDTLHDTGVGEHKRYQLLRRRRRYVRHALGRYDNAFHTAWSARKYAHILIRYADGAGGVPLVQLLAEQDTDGRRRFAQYRRIPRGNFAEKRRPSAFHLLRIGDNS